MSRIVTIGAAQMGPIAPDESRESCVKRMVELIRQAKSRGCTFVVFPELALTTFFPRYYEEDISRMDHWYETEMPGPATRPLFEAAAEAGIGFYLGYAELTPDGHRYNTAVLVDETGRINGKYRKVHLPGHSEYEAQRPFQHLEKRYFEPGDLGFGVWRQQGGIFGMAICNDRRWAETYRVMGLKGAEVISLGYNTPDINTSGDEPNHRRMFHNHLVMQANAYMNATWVVGVAKAGVEDGCMLIGGSCIIQPSGEITALATSVDDELVTTAADLDLCNMPKATIFNFERHRRVEHYGIISSQTGAELPPELADAAE
jgi:N-carbamoyl-D-amino-acid hydrolase